jgi:hypothetical protein
MSISKQISSVFALLSVILLGAIGTLAQEHNPAVIAFQEWQAKPVTAKLTASGKFLAMAFAVTKPDNSTAVIDIAIAAGWNVDALGEMTFVIQPMTPTHAPSGRKVLEPVGHRSTIRLPAIEYARAYNGQIISTPRITIPVPAGTVSIKVTVDGISEPRSGIFSWRDEVSTGIIARPLN